MYEQIKEALDELTAPGQMFEVAEIEVRGQRLKSWAMAPPTLRDLWALSAAHADKDYLVYRDERWTYAEAHQQVNAIAAWLAANGVKQHDRVAIAMRNYPEWMLAYWAITTMGAVAVGMNAWWVTEEMAYAVEDAKPTVLICDSERLARFAEVGDRFPNLKVVAVRTETQLPEGVVDWSTVIATEPGMPEVSIDPDDDACIFYTSGTTGNPKGAQLTHRGCTNNVMSVVFSSMLQIATKAKVSGEAPADPSDPQALQPSCVIATPLFHVTGNNCLAQSMTAGGGKLVHMYKWDAGEALRLIEAEKVTAFTGVPVMSRELIAHPDFATRDTSSLASMGGGGAPMQPDLVDKIARQGGASKPQQGYGMTEVCGIISAIGGGIYTSRPASAGMIVPIFDSKCVGEDGVEVPTGERGEVWVKGCQVIKGYINRPEETAETIVDGWLKTGDIGYLDAEGFLYLVDRAKEMVLRGGENIGCSEVETALFKHNSVAECAVFSVPDERLGEEVGAAVFPAPGTNPSVEELKSFCREQLAAYKVPRYMWILDEPLPRNASGKFVKRELQQMLDPKQAG